MKKNLIVARTVAMIIGVLLGVLLLVLGNVLTPETVVKIIDIGLIIYGIIVIIGNIPGLVSGAANIHKPAGVFDLVASIIGIALGVTMVFYQGAFIVILVAVYLILFPLVRVLLAPDKGEQFKRELLRMVLGVVLLIFLPALFDAAFTVVHLLLVIAGWFVIGLSVLFGVVEIIRIATAKNLSAPETDHIYVDFEEKQD